MIGWGQCCSDMTNLTWSKQSLTGTVETSAQPKWLHAAVIHLFIVFRLKYQDLTHIWFILFQYQWLKTASPATEYKLFHFSDWYQTRLDRTRQRQKRNQSALIFWAQQHLKCSALTYHHRKSPWKDSRCQSCSWLVVGAIIAVFK